MQPQMPTSKLSNEAAGRSTTRSAEGSEMERPAKAHLELAGRLYQCEGAACGSVCEWSVSPQTYFLSGPWLIEMREEQGEDGDERRGFKS